MTAPGSPVVGVLLAAGRSRRMGRLKQTLPWPPGSAETTVVAASFDLLSPFCSAMVVVFGHEVSEVRRALLNRSFAAASADPDAPMAESIRAGLNAAAALLARASVLLHPADHPATAPATVKAILECASANPGKAVMPEHRGVGGHPVYVPAPLVPQIVADSMPRGLRGFWEDHPQCRIRLEVSDAGAVHDLDVPQDYSCSGRDPDG